MRTPVAAPDLDGPCAMDELAEYLGPFVFRWLIACSSLPVLRFSLTRHFGAALARADSRAPPTEREFLALAALPWFRQGWLPTHLRKNLLELQSHTDAAVVRQTLLDISFSAIQVGRADQ